MKNFEQLWEEAKTFGILQKKEELRMFAEYIIENMLSRESFLEIGTAGGGMASILLRFFQAGYSIDMLPCWNFHRLKEINENFHQYVGLSWGGMTYHYFVNMGIQFDLLFIDGAHDLNSAMRDFTLYKKLVRPGGLIAFHDIIPDNGFILGEQVNVKPLWDLLTEHYEHRMFISLTQEKIGIDFLDKLKPSEWGGIGCIIV